ncbi:MAG: hypothetical protein J6U49_07500 [Alistipes sp.]|nr:hypothetical protein [Alistipes sp.]
MATKKYGLTRMFSLVTTFKTPSGMKVVCFERGSRHHGRNGYLITSDKELQEAIENSPKYGNEIELLEETADVAKVEDKTPQEPVIVDYRSMLTDPENAIEEPSVTTIQKAKMWLQANYGKSFKSTSKDEIKREAATTYNALFPNWL